LSVSGFSSELFFVAQLHLICLLPSQAVATQGYGDEKLKRYTSHFGYSSFSFLHQEGK
jgi:hypothetical protein